MPPDCHQIDPSGLLARDYSSPTACAGRKFLFAPRTSFNGRITPHRRFAFGKLPLQAAKDVKNAHGCTVNDVVVSICAGAVRRWLIEHDDLPDDPLVTQIPVSVRTKEQIGTYGNRILLMTAPMYTNMADPVKREEWLKISRRPWLTIILAGISQWRRRSSIGRSAEASNI